ncbi:MAG: nucleotidyltransferase domain-containing protein [Actinomycetota bacterium]
MDFVRPLAAVLPGVQGRILAVLAETSAELNLRTIARLAVVSEAQASRILPRLVSLGLVERHEAPPSALFRLLPEHIAVGPIVALARSWDRMLEASRGIAERLPLRPASIVVFGSFARGEAELGSDIDTLLVRPLGIDESDETWAATVQQWIDRVSMVSGNRVEVLEVGEAEVAARLASQQTVWQEISRHGILVDGSLLDSLQVVPLA